MRKTINVLWLDDSDNESDVEYLEDIFKEVLEDNGYITNIINVKNVNEANNSINGSNIKIDFFVSDYNLEEDRSGVDFLKEVRNNNRYREHFILYSNLDKKTIRDKIFGEIKIDKEKIDILNNYSFFSTGSNASKSVLKKHFSASVTMALVRWEELSALRGEYASLNTLAEWTARKIMYALTSDHLYIPTGHDNSSYVYFGVIKALKDAISSNRIVSSLSNATINITFDKWHKIRKLRNDLEHNTEKYDASRGDYYISSSDSLPLYEKNILHERKQLIVSMMGVKELLEDLVNNNNNLSSIKSDVDYINFVDNFQ